MFLRYGFEPYSLRRESLDPHLTDSLKYVFDAFIGQRKDWMWLSVARLRKSVLSAHRAVLAKAAQVQREVEAINETTRKAAQRRHANRFAALWDLPLVEKPLVIEEGSDEPTAPVDEIAAVDEPAKVKKGKGTRSRSEENDASEGPAGERADAEESA